jgi:Sec-independent protein translocase protein TatA
VAFGTELLLVSVLGFLLLGPKRLPATLRHIARAKARLQDVTQNLKIQLDSQLNMQSDSKNVRSSGKIGGEQ